MSKSEWMAGIHTLVAHSIVAAMTHFGVVNASKCLLKSPNNTLTAGDVATTWCKAAKAEQLKAVPSILVQGAMRFCGMTKAVCGGFISSASHHIKSYL